MTIATDDRYSCSRCGAEFTSPDERREHARQSHEDSQLRVPMLVDAER